MNFADLPLATSPLTAMPLSDSGQALLTAVCAIAQGPLKAQAEAIDRGLYPSQLLRSLAAAGGMSAHLEAPFGEADYGLAISAMAEVSRVCGATGFMVWCHDACGLYMEESGNPALTGQALLDHASAHTLCAPLKAV